MVPAAASRLSKRVLDILEMRRAAATSEWVFPAPTKSGHIEGSTLKKQHAAALTASGVAPFVLYTFRHTCITRWAKHMDPFTLHVLAGYTDMNTTTRYVHPSEADIREAMEKLQHSLEQCAGNGRNAFTGPLAVVSSAAPV